MPNETIFCNNGSKLTVQWGKAQPPGFGDTEQPADPSVILTSRWIGAPAGMSPAKPMVSIDETELRAPLRPASADPDFELGIPGFAIQAR